MREGIIQGKKEIAVVEDGRLVGYRKLCGDPVQTGAVFWGRMTKCAAGDTGGCFVDIGADSNAFCAQKGEHRQGDFLPVMVTNPARDQKAPRVSPEIRITGRFLVLLNQQGFCGVSQKISDPAVRSRLQSIGEEIIRDTEIPGLILRTEAAGAAEAQIGEEAASLQLLWRKIRAGKDSAGLLYCPDPYGAFLNRYGKFDSLLTDDTGVYEQLRERYPEIRFRPSREYDLFTVKSVSAQLVSLFGRCVRLPGGGDIVIEKTEALTVIDVNSGKAVGNQAAALAVNLEAAREIMRQLRLREIGGSVVCDFIRMKPEERETVQALLQTLSREDFAKPRIHGFTALGLAEISRKRS